MNQINTEELINFLLSKQNTKSIDILEGFKLFQAHNHLYKRSATINFYVTTLKMLFAYFDWKNVHTTAQITKELLNNYIVYRTSNFKIKAVTVNKELKSLYALLNFLVKRNFIDGFPKVEFLPEETPKIETVHSEDIKRLLEYAHTLCNQSELIIRLLISTGIRTTELTFITKDCIDLDNNQIYLEHTKTGKPRYIFISDDYTKNLIIKNINENKKNNFLLFSSKDGSQLTANAIRVILKKIKRKLNIEVLSPHKLRHTYATNLISHGADIESVRLLMGHSTYEMTKRYLHLSTSHIKSINNQFNILKMSQTHWLLSLLGLGKKKEGASYPLLSLKYIDISNYF